MDKPVAHDVLIVFAGGPHTGSRLARAVERVRIAPPTSICLTGVEFHDAKCAPAIQQLSELAHVKVDDARSTVQSCRAIARRLILGEILSWLYCFPLGLLHLCRRPADPGASP